MHLLFYYLYKVRVGNRYVPRILELEDDGSFLMFWPDIGWIVFGSC